MPLHLAASNTFTTQEAVGINTGQMAVTQDAPLVSTGAAYCIILLFHVDGVGGALAHVPPGVDESPAMEKMMDALMKKGAQSNQVEVLVAGAAGREEVPHWRQDFLTKLNRLGIQLGNIIDGRTPTSSWKVNHIGNRPAESIKSLVYDPKVSGVRVLGIEGSHPTKSKGKSGSVKVYDIASPTGVVSTTAREGECLIL